jgi:protein SCO1/2
VFFLFLPFLQSFLFSSNKQGFIEVQKQVELDFIKSDKKFIILFFGYVGCTDVCTPLLKRLDSMYNSKEFEDIKVDTEFVFVNLTHEIDSYQPKLFANFFNNNFKGLYLSKRGIFNIDREFGLFFSRDLLDESQMNHTDYLYLIDNRTKIKVLKKMYNTHPLNMDAIIRDIKKYKLKKEKNY